MSVIGYTSSIATRIIATALPKFHAAAPRGRVELADVSSREINRMAGEGGLDLVLCPGVCVAKGIPGFRLTELRRVQPVLVLPAGHPLAKLKRIPVARLRHLPLVGLAKDNYPEYVTSARELLKPFGFSPRFVSLVNDNFSTLFVELEAQNAAAILLEGIDDILPQTLVARPFALKLPSVAVVIGLPALRPKPHAETFVRLLTAEAQTMDKKEPRSGSVPRPAEAIRRLNLLVARDQHAPETLVGGRYSQSQTPKTTRPKVPPRQQPQDGTQQSVTSSA
jgi:LysR family transcriptional regulator, benzoate and cis,cis-muconate-responsive activator of ben and cat genes